MRDDTKLSIVFLCIIHSLCKQKCRTVLVMLDCKKMKATQVFTLFCCTNKLIHAMSCHEFCDKRVRDMTISLLQVKVKFGFDLNPTFTVVTIHNACLTKVSRPRIVCSAWAKIMYTVCFETFNIDRQSFLRQSG